MKPGKGFIVVISIIVIGILAFLVWQGYLWQVNMQKANS